MGFDSLCKNKIFKDLPNYEDIKVDKHMEEVSLRYEKLTWTFVDGSIEFTDSWKEGR